MPATPPTAIRDAEARSSRGHTADPGDHARLRFRRFAWTTAAIVLVAIVIGGIVRVTGSGLGCGDDWPLCHGYLIPPMSFETVLEYGHRLKALVVTVAVLGLAGYALRHRALPGFGALVRPALLAVVLLFVQVALGAITVILVLPASTTILHLGTAMALLGTLLVAAVRTYPSTGAARGDGFTRLARITAGFALVVVLFGAMVANSGLPPASAQPSAAAWACQGFPLCNGQLLPAANHFVGIHWAHRMLAYLFALHMIGFAFAARKRRPGATARWGWIALGLVAAQVIVAATMILHQLPHSLRAIHMALGGAIWGSLVVAAVFARRTVPVEGRGGEHGRELPLDIRMTTATERAGLTAVQRSGPGALSQRLRDYVTLTKPRIISLLLVTTLVPMIIAVRGWPGGWTVFWTMLGGYLMAGGANAINMYLDRDIDARMGRTALRPIPSGRMSPAHVLAFGIVLGAAAFAIFALWVNLLSGVLALAGLLYYVFVYTRWLKRTSPQNIVIGGAAGAFPPLVGWTAATGEMSLTALYLFLIVFFWTPPHFWALALVKQKDYGRVGVPMAPNVWGERETMRQILLYTLILIPLTLVPVTYGGLGMVYALLALTLGGWLLAAVVRLLRAPLLTEPAWSLYRRSLLYLALLFGAMVVDGILPVGHSSSREAEVVRLRSPVRGPVNVLPLAEVMEPLPR
ncbi:heme o synthase [soil metagenome]